MTESYRYRIEIPDHASLVDVIVPDMHKYYKHFAFAITLSHDTPDHSRIESARKLLLQMTESCPDIPVSIIFNRCKVLPLPKLPDEFYADNISLQITDELISFGRCWNLHTIANSDREYVVCFGDKDRFRFDKVLDAIIDAHITHKADLVRGFYSTAFSIFKQTLAKLSWWDERYYFPWNDIDMERRLLNAEVVQTSLPPHKYFTRVPKTVLGYYHLEELDGFDSKQNGVAFHHMKWGDDCNPNIPIGRQAKLPEIDWHPEYTKLFEKHKRLWEVV